ncbi:M1 family metallopeptidase [soil metagenome]
MLPTSPIRALVTRLIILTVVVASFTPGFVAAMSAREVASVPSLALYDAILPDFRDDIYAQTSDLLPIYDVSASFNLSASGPSTITGTTRLAYVNFTDAAQNVVHLRLYPNAPTYLEGGMVLDDVRVSGEQVSPQYLEDNTLVAISLPRTLAPGDHIDLTIQFTSTIPFERNQSYGMFGFDQEAAAFNLAHWQPLLTGWTPGIGWYTGPLDMRGDPVFSNAALFSVQLQAPSELVFATTGVSTSAVEMGNVTVHRWESGPSRDFVMIANPNFLIAEGLAGETVVRSFYTPETAEIADDVLDMATASLEIFNDLFGPYPYREFDLAEAYIGPRAAGVEFPGLAYISRNLYDIENPNLEFTIVHEVAHQWWYAMVGNNQYLHAFLDESLSNYVSIVYIELRYGPEAADEAVNRFLKRSYFAALFGAGGDQIVNQPTASFPSDRSYGRIVYGKGALGMQAIRQAIGLDAFNQALTNYAALHRFGVALPADLLNAFEQASNSDLSALWRHWFEAAEGEQDFVPADLVEIT